MPVIITFLACLSGSAPFKFHFFAGFVIYPLFTIRILVAIVLMPIGPQSAWILRKRLARFPRCRRIRFWWFFVCPPVRLLLLGVRGVVGLLLLLVIALLLALVGARAIGGRALCVAVEIGGGFGIVGDHSVEVEGLGICKVGIWYGHWSCRPVGAEPTAVAIGVVASAKVVVAGFLVAFFAFEFVGLRAIIRVGAFAAVRIEVGVIGNERLFSK